MTYKSSTIKSKWKKTKWLLEESHLKQYVPATLPFSKGNLTSMLSSYSTVFFKPTSGSGGNNIIRIKKKDGGYQTQYNTVKTTYTTQEKLYKGLKRFAGKKDFLLQKGIRLAKSNGKPFDIRVMVQKTNKGSWVSTGLFTKVGKPNKVATNYNQGGTVEYFNKTMARSEFNSISIQQMEHKLKQLGVSVGHNFDRHYKGFKELGLDVALDQSGKPWILEVNTRPQFYPLKALKDKSLYHRIVSYGKQYGRTK
ncbi:YheC/D like ATP-grasp [Paenibacillus uliginis N3/975]|uniref:YheC/D like ATP-grasp n=1 Tax=Paenibacillus uliginis N3/975 TaxID=1313296 RepID=A0A1X7HNW8_9BACL|nr:YheC/YheD family protein [Paenibacillus uliginis]SMF90029.1 YheC/D like ATP-grasp [Paenibacillus uliginis N3/975]